MFRRLGELSSRYPRRVLAFWGALLLLCAPLAGRVGEVLTSDAGAAPNSEARAVRQLLGREFAGATGFQLVLVAPGAAEPDAAARFERVLQELSAQPEVAGVLSSGAQRLGPAAPGAALITLSSRTHEEADAATTALRALLPELGGGLELLLTGSVAVEQEIAAISGRDTVRAELFGLPLSLLVLVLAFGALVAACLPLLVAALSVTLSLAALTLLGQLFTFATFAQIVVTMLGLATGIDYALLMVNRYREELARTPDPAQAAVRTTQSAGKAVAFSGLTVLVALCALLVPPLAFVRSIGVASAVVMFFSVVVSLTALPAALTLLGPRVNALRLTRRPPGSRSRRFWAARAQAVTARPWFWALSGSAALLLLAAPALRMEVAFAGVRGLTQETDARRAQDGLEALGLGSLARPFDLVLDFGERGFFHPSSVRAVAALTRAALAVPQVSHALTPTPADGLPPLLLAGYYATPEAARASPLGPLVGATVSESGRYALLRVFPESGLAPRALRALEAELRALAAGAELEARLGGSVVLEREWADALYRSFPYAVALVYLTTFVLLGLAFRSVLIPLKSIVLNTLTVGAAFGVITAVFQHGWGARLLGLGGGLGFIESSVPIFIFAIVFGLSMDYEVFLVSRIVEYHRQGLSDREAVVGAVAATGGVITSAALIMGVVFAVFLFSHVVLIKTLALGLSVAVLLDATLVRLALVPAVTLLAGRWNWWLPQPVARLTRRLDVGHD